MSERTVSRCGASNPPTCSEPQAIDYMAYTVHKCTQCMIAFNTIPCLVVPSSWAVYLQVHSGTVSPGQPVVWSEIKAQHALIQAYHDLWSHIVS